MNDFLPVGKLHMGFLSGLLAQYTGGDDRITIGAKIGEDAAVIDLGDRLLVAKTNVITFATNQIGWYVVNVCVNNMVVRGVRPRWMLNCILLPENGTTEQMVEEIFRDIYEASKKMGVSIIGGHTEVTYGLDRPIIAGHLMGEIPKDKLVTTGGARVGDTVLITKTLGVEGTAIIARELAHKLKERGYEDDFIQRSQDFLYDPGISIYTDALTAADSGLVRAMTDATEGGLATALHEMASAAGVGLLIDADKIPVLPETQRLCEEFSIDPMGLIASGMMLMTADPKNVDRLIAAMQDARVRCTAIGKVTDAADGYKLVRAGEITDLPYYSSDELTKVL